MTSDDTKSKEELLQKLNSLQQKAAEAEGLRSRLEKVENLYGELEEKFEKQSREYAQERAERDRTEEMLRMANVIIDKSPVILFRRLLGDQPSLLYFSRNIARFGYTTDGLLYGTMDYKDIVHPDDLARFEEEIRDYAEKDVEEYTQIYRILTKSGEVRWIKDQTSVVKDANGIKTQTQGVLVDITEHKKALELAGEVQKSLLPQKNLRINGLDIAGRSIPCEEIGGDYFDYLLGEEYPDRPFSVVVGDITGHGVDAALLMTSARTFLRMRSSQPGSISQIVNEMNRHLTRDVLDTGRFMTLLYMTIDTDSGNLRWVRAGHDPAIIYDPVKDQFEELKGRGLALGLDEEFAYEENLKTELTSGQIIAIGTDGIWESFNRDGEMYGKERFHSIFRKNASAEADDIVNAIYNDLESFRSGLKPEDDITLVVIRVT
ncbi:MAG: SpoIIE family protein phosphatase [Deltaproteobacteria bacterium]|nr:MAG: SpoIIE family protein phosphatase [Deltaproteobacteria bacterium]